ncbi:MAG: hypothetical protein KDA86_13250 [Planctomycetaceae bacterium]|nr:hypothetical protein [Planctomycetaceae bacterium]
MKAPTPPLLLCLAGIVSVLGLVSGCGGSPPPAAVVKPPTPQIQPLDGPVVFEEGILKRLEPVIANRDEINGGLRFELRDGELPKDCKFDQTTGVLEWTPDEFQGSSHHNLQFSCALEDDPTLATEYAVEFEVKEINSPPKLAPPEEITISAGSILEQPLRPADDDFPVNQITLSLESGPQGASIDSVRKLVYWEIPADWQKPQVEFVVSARDDGVPPLTTTQQFVVSITDIVPPKPENTEESRFRVPPYAVDLPPLPRKPLGKQAEPIESTTLELEFDPPLDAADVSLSLMLPDELRADLKTRYPDEHDASHLAILLTEPFEAEDVPGNLTDQIVATCKLVDSKLVWTWALINKPKEARGFQNNLRSGVLVIGSKSGNEERLVALQAVQDLAVPTLEAMLGSDGLKKIIHKTDRVTKSIPFIGRDCQAVNRTWTTRLESHIDGFALNLFSPILTQEINSGTNLDSTKFAEFNFRVIQIDNDITIGLDANPSPDDVWKKLKAAIKLVKDDWDNHARLKEKLKREENELKSAQNMLPQNEGEKLKKEARMSGAKNRINALTLELKKLEAKIPGDERNRDVKQAEWKAMEAQFQPFFNCIVTGELHREIEDVRIPVYRLVAVADDLGVDAQQE